jgi:hypothetical protein
MKNLSLIVAVLILLTGSLLAQNRQRYFDNFDSARGVQITNSSSSVSKAGSGAHYLPSPVATRNTASARPGTKLVKRTAQVTMTVYDGFAHSEAPRPTERLTMTAGNHLKGYSTGDSLIDAFIVDSSRRYNIDPLLIYSQMGQESSYKLRALSNKGASGLMQLMPATARRLGVTQIYDPKQNIEGGVKYMRMLLDMFGQDLNLALAGYNAGEGAVIKYGYQIPPYNETRDYVRRISARYKSISTAAASEFRSIKTAATPARLYQSTTISIPANGNRTQLTNR